MRTAIWRFEIKLRKLNGTIRERAHRGGALGGDIQNDEAEESELCEDDEEEVSVRSVNLETMEEYEGVAESFGEPLGEPTREGASASHRVTFSRIPIAGKSVETGSVHLNLL